VRYRFIREHEGRFSVSALCRVLQVSRSGYIAWKKRPLSPCSQQEQRLLVEIRAIHQGSRGTYGSPRITQELWAKERACSRNRVARIMRKYEITARPHRRYVTTTDSAHPLPVAPNRLERKFMVEEPNTHGSADITYLWTGEGWLYLSVVLDLYSRRVVGWSMRETLDRSIVLNAMEGALHQRNPEPGLICHSDRGSQYASGDYPALLTGAGALCSMNPKGVGWMSRKGNCYDNAPVESFFASLKRELVHRCNFSTREEARSAVFEWIAVWYNRKRRHSTPGYLSPEQFEQQQPLDAMRRAA
jgi:putative transposase